MSDAAAPKATPKKAAAKKPKAKASHPSSNDMIVAAIKNLKDRKGSSSQAIKKYIGANYKVDIVKMSPFIRKAFKSLLEKKKIVQTKGTGASGSFKLAEKAVAKKPATKKPAAKKSAAKKSPKKAAAKKPAAKKSPKKAAKKPAAKKAPAKKSPAKKAAKKPAAKKAPAKKAAPKKK